MVNSSQKIPWPILVVLVIKWLPLLAPSTTVEISRCKRPVVGVGKENFLASLTEEPMVHNAYATRPTTFLGQSVPRFTHASSALLKKVSAKKLDCTLLLSKKDIGGQTRQAQIWPPFHSTPAPIQMHASVAATKHPITLVLLDFRELFAPSALPTSFFKVNSV